MLVLPKLLKYTWMKKMTMIFWDVKIYCYLAVTKLTVLLANFLSRYNGEKFCINYSLNSQSDGLLKKHEKLFSLNQCLKKLNQCLITIVLIINKYQKIWLNTFLKLNRYINHCFLWLGKILKSTNEESKLERFKKR